MSYSVMLYNRKAVILYSVTSYRNQNSIVSYLVAIDRNWYAVVSYSVTWYPNLNYVVSYPVNLYCNLNDVVLYPITIDGIQEIVMLHTTTVYYSQDAVTSYPIVSRCRFLSCLQGENVVSSLQNWTGRLSYMTIIMCRLWALYMLGLFEVLYLLDVLCLLKVSSRVKN